MPFPLLGLLGGLAAGVGTAGGAYGLATGIKDRNEQKKRQREAQEGARRQQQQAKNYVGPTGNGGFQAAPNQGSFWGGSPAGLETYNQYTPQQQAGMDQVLQRALSGIGSHNFDFGPIEEQARRGFAEKTVPGIAERFTSLGAQKSSAFGQQLGAAGAGLEMDLAAMKQNYGLQQQQLLHNLLGIGLRPQFESLYRQGQEGFGSSFGKNLAQNLLTGDNLAAGFNGLKNLFGRKKDGQNPGQAAIDVLPFQPTYNQGKLQGAMQGVYNPGNIVAGVQAPQIPYVPQVNQGQQMGGIQALKGLYGI